MQKKEHIGTGNNDRFLLTVSTLKMARKIRFALLVKFKPRSWVYVVKTSHRKKGWDIFLSNKQGGYPDQSHYEKALKTAKKILKEK